MPVPLTTVVVLVKCYVCKAGFKPGNGYAKTAMNHEVGEMVLLCKEHESASQFIQSELQWFGEWPTVHKSSNGYKLSTFGADFEDFEIPQKEKVGNPLGCDCVQTGFSCVHHQEIASKQ